MASGEREKRVALYDFALWFWSWRSLVLQGFLGAAIFASAQQRTRKIVQCGLPQRGERERSRGFDGGEAEPRRQQAVEHALAEPGRKLGCQSMADHLLDQAVARRHAARHGDV